MIHRLAVGLVAVTCVSLVACGGGGIDSAGEAVRGQWNAICQKVHQCRDSAPATPEQFEAIFGANASACVAMFAAEAEADGQSPEDYDAAEEAGNLILLADNVNACFAWIRSLTCEQVWSDDTQEPEECNLFFEGQVASGGACTLDDECVDGFCDGTCF